MEVNIVCVGNLKESFWKSAVDEYVKRLSAFAKTTVVEVKESKYLDSEADIVKAKKEEANLLNKYRKGYSIALEVKGKEYSSEGLADKIKKVMVDGASCITFFIGGSFGLDEEFSKSCDEQISFSKFTFPHNLMRVILVEQVYRSFMINSNKTYHK